MLPFIFLKREYAQEPKSVITTKSLIWAVVTCCVVGLALPLYFRSITLRKNKDAYIAGLKINGQRTYTLKVPDGEIIFSITLNESYFEIVGKCNNVHYPLRINHAIKIVQAGNSLEVWRYGRVRYPEEIYPVIVNEKYIRWRTWQFPLRDNVPTELVFERDFIDGTSYARCPLSPLR